MRLRMPPSTTTQFIFLLWTVFACILSVIADDQVGVERTGFENQPTKVHYFDDSEVGCNRLRGRKLTFRASYILTIAHGTYGDQAMKARLGKK